MKKYTLFAALCWLFSSCLTNERAKLDLYDGTEITSFSLEYRYSIVPKSPDPDGKDGLPQMRVVNIEADITTNDPNVSSASSLANPPEGSELNSITLTPYLPRVRGTFTQAEQDKISNTQIWGVTSISPGATIIPMGDAPRLGVPGDFSAPRQYKVISANGESKIWTLLVAPFNPPKP